MPVMELKKGQYEEFTKILTIAFPTKKKLTQMLRFSSNERLENIAADGDLLDIAFEIVQTAEAEEWIMDLVEGARRANPNNSRLRAFEEKIKQDPEIGQSITHKAWKIFHEENFNFAGREELLESLENNLNKGEAAALTQAIHGLGGIGKTQLAVKYTYKYQKQYEVIWWLRAEEETTLASDYGRLALELAVTTSVKVEEQIQATQNWLNSNDKWLLVFDNATDSKIIHRYVPNKHLGHIIITSRNPNWGAIATPLQVRIWTEKESLDFLLNRLSFSLDERQREKAKELGEELGYLPLALAQAAAYIDNNNQDIEAYLQLFRTQRQELWKNEEAPIHYIEKQAGKSKGENKEKYTVATTWLTALGKIKKTTGAKEVLTLCAFLAPDNIPIDIIVEHSNHLPKKLANTLKDKLKQNQAIKTLCSYSLINKINNDVSIHRLIQTVIHDLLTPKQQKEWTNITTKLISEALPHEPLDLEARKIAKRLSSHAEYAVTQAIKDKTLVHLLTKLGRYFQKAAFYEKSTTVLRTSSVNK